jgi:threonine/homoserine/homoserine lactone efflux protein
MEFSFFRGLIIGVSIAAPVGPIGILCIRRTLSDGRWIGLLSGLGAATADAIYGSIAGFGLTFVSGFFIHHVFWFRLLGGLFLCYLGIQTIFAQPSKKNIAATGRSGMEAYLSTAFLTLTNPATILSFAAIFAGLGLADTNKNYGASALLVSGVFAGSALWWLLLSSGVGLFRSHLTPNRLQWLNRISGSILLGFGIIALSPVG